MIYKELINELKKVKRPEHMTEELLEMMTSATMDAHVGMYLQDEDVMPFEAIEMTRIGLLKELDFMLLDLHQMINQNTTNEQILDLSNAPIGDDILKEQLDKAFNDYNERLDKEPTKLRKL